MSITKLSPNWACQMGPIHCPKFLLSGTQPIYCIVYSLDAALTSQTPVYEKTVYLKFQTFRSVPNPFPLPLSISLPFPVTSLLRPSTVFKDSGPVVYRHTCRLSPTPMGPSIKYVTLFRTNFDPLPCHTSWDLPKVRHISRTPIFRSTYINTYALVREGIVRVVLSGSFSGRFCPGWSFPPPFCQNTSITTES